MTGPRSLVRRMMPEGVRSIQYSSSRLARAFLQKANAA